MAEGTRFVRIRGRIVPIKGDRKPKGRSKAQLKAQLKRSEKMGSRSDKGSAVFGLAATGVGAYLASGQLGRLATNALGRVGQHFMARDGLAALKRRDLRTATKMRTGILEVNHLRKKAMRGFSPKKLALGAGLTFIGSRALGAIDDRKEKREKKQSKLRAKIRRAR